MDGPQYRPQNTMVLIMRTRPQKSTPNSGKPPDLEALEGPEGWSPWLRALSVDLDYTGEPACFTCLASSDSGCQKLWNDSRNLTHAFFW